jgi:predicted ATPase
MKLESIAIEAHPPIKKFAVDNLSNVVVFAGPNGVGKTRLIGGILETLRNVGGDRRRLVVRATCESERQAWQSDTLDTAVPEQAQKLRQTLQRNRRRGKWQSSAYHIDSQRQVSQINPLNWSWSFADPSIEEVGWDFAFHGLANRYQDTIHSIRRMLGYHRTAIAKKALELQRAGQREMALDFPDPLEPFQRAFALLLAPKQLAPMELEWHEPRYTINGQMLELGTLSSGEREVFSIVMDLVLHQPEDCIIFFDEPELHLHPELSFRLLKTLQTIGVRNQFILCTHSADLISSSLEHSVVFVSPPRDRANQGIAIKPGDESAVALKELGQSLGVISLGKKIVLIEGTERSLDRDTYGSITQGLFPSLVLVPSGSRQTSLSFAKVVEEVLDRTLWGIDFFMLADRDTSLPEAQLADLEAHADGRLKFLPRLHVENYFLDARTIASAFRDLVGADSWLRDPAVIEGRLHSLAREAIPVAVNMWLSTQLRSLVGEIDVALKDVEGKSEVELAGMLPARVAEEHRRVNQYLDHGFAEAELRKRWATLTDSLAARNEAWRFLFPGKLLVGRFCGAARINKGYFTSLYIAHAHRQEANPFQELIDIFAAWAGRAARPAELIRA